MTGIKCLKKEALPPFLKRLVPGPKKKRYGDGKKIAQPLEIYCITDQAQTELFNRVFLYFKDGKSINWKKIDMPGRNLKSVTNMWTRLNKPILELEARIGTPGSPSTPDQTPTKIKRE